MTTATTVVLKRQPSKAICADECGAQCCRAPGHFLMTYDEMERLHRLGTELDIRMRILRPTFRPANIAAVMEFANNDGACPFLDRDTNLCRIYEERPNACRSFPTTYEERCLLV